MGCLWVVFGLSLGCLWVVCGLSVGVSVAISVGMSQMSMLSIVAVSHLEMGKSKTLKNNQIVCSVFHVDVFNCGSSHISNS